MVHFDTMEKDALTVCYCMNSAPTTCRSVTFRDLTLPDYKPSAALEQATGGIISGFLPAIIVHRETF